MTWHLNITKSGLIFILEQLTIYLYSCIVITKSYFLCKYGKLIYVVTLVTAVNKKNSPLKKIFSLSGRGSPPLKGQFFFFLENLKYFGGDFEA